MRTLLLLSLIFFITGCSTKRPDNAWQYDAAASAKYAERYFLEGRYLLSQGEFRRAEKNAKQSGNMTPLARLYLGKCALNRSVLLEDDCREYTDIAALSDENELKSYYALLSGTLSAGEINDVPDQYRIFAAAYLKGDKKSIRKALENITPLTSKMVAASLSQEYLDEQIIESIIAEASHLGYRRAVIAWMRHLLSITKDEKKRNILKHKIGILTKP